MDIKSLTEGLGFLGTVLTILKQAKDLSPDGPAKDKITEALKQAEKKKKKFRFAQAQTAQELGYQICRNHTNPGIMISSDDIHWECPECGNRREVDNPDEPAIEIVPFWGRR